MEQGKPQIGSQKRYETTIWSPKELCHQFGLEKIKTHFKLVKKLKEWTYLK